MSVTISPCHLPAQRRRRSQPTEQGDGRQLQLAPAVGDVGLLTVRDAAALLGVSERTIRARIARRTIPFRRWGSRVLFVRAELSEFIRTLEGCEVGEATENITKRQR